MPNTTTPGIEIPLDDWVWVRAGTWSEHKLGNNYGAKLTSDSSAPGGIHRAWLLQDKTKPGIIMRDLAPGDAFEIGSTTIDDKRAAVKHRTYGVVIYVDKTRFIYSAHTTATDAIKAADKMTLELPGNSGPIPFIQRQIRNIDTQISELHRQKAELLAQAANLVIDQTGHMDITEDNRVVASVTEGLTPQDTTNLPKLEDPHPTPGGPNLPLHKLMGLPPTGDDTDDEEEELSPAQIAAMKKLLG